jgi:hypothetical protein
MAIVTSYASSAPRTAGVAITDPSHLPPLTKGAYTLPASRTLDLSTGSFASRPSP